MAVKPPSYRLRPSSDSPRVTDGATVSSDTVGVGTEAPQHRTDSGRANQKVTKPQFFDSYRLERSNASLLDVARGHFAKKAVASSVDWADGLVDDENAVPWGGLLSKDILAREFVPMAVKVQTLSKREL